MERTSSLVRLSFVLNEWFSWLMMVNLWCVLIELVCKLMHNRRRYDAQMIEGLAGIFNDGR